ncbi:unnamed protein product, partial [marine sediment metagenome]
LRLDSVGNGSEGESLSGICLLSLKVNGNSGI